MESQRGSNMSKVTQLIVEPACEQKDLTQVHAPDRDATSCVYVSVALESSALAGRVFTTEPPGKPMCVYAHTIIYLTIFLMVVVSSFMFCYINC